MKMFYLCIVNKNDGIGAQGNKNLLSGLAKFSACPERKKEVAKGDEVSKQQFSINLNFIFTTMTMKVKAIEKKLKFSKDPNDPGVYRYVMSPEQYSSLNQKKVIKEAALRSDVSFLLYRTTVDGCRIQK